MPDFRFDPRPCPECGHHPTRWQRCTSIDCQNGRYDVSEKDPVLYPSTGPVWRTCDRCKGAGHEHWCPECGADLTHRDDLKPAHPQM